jgi:SAM-dependent methyltransferase
MKNFFLKFLKFFFLNFYDKGLISNIFISKKFKDKLEIRKKNKFMAKLFLANKSLIFNNEKSYWNLNPMPSKIELDIYYKNQYWSEQNEDKQDCIHLRDIDHFLLMKKMVPDFFSSKKTILNFGSGHGGISYLFWINNHRVINIEPSLAINKFMDNWVVYNDIEKVSEKVDFIYGSHSLEHVRDLDKLEIIFYKILNNNGYIFFEVPNALVDSNGGSNGKIFPPHTYYFTKNYFNTLDFDVILNATYKEGSFPFIRLEDDKGEVIRYLGCKK